jgi:hypothetical protein
MMRAQQPTAHLCQLIKAEQAQPALQPQQHRPQPLSTRPVLQLTQHHQQTHKHWAPLKHHVSTQQSQQTLQQGRRRARAQQHQGLQQLHDCFTRQPVPLLLSCSWLCWLYCCCCCCCCCCLRMWHCRLRFCWRACLCLCTCPCCCPSGAVCYCIGGSKELCRPLLLQLPRHPQLRHRHSRQSQAGRIHVWEHGLQVCASLAHERGGAQEIGFIQISAAAAATAATAATLLATAAAAGVAAI